MKLTGSCLCGDIAFEIDGPVDTVGHSHCSMCHKFHGSAFATLGTTAPEDFRWMRGAEQIRTYQSSVPGYRSFCPRCGSALPLSGEDLPFTLVPLGNVAEDPGTRPRLHFFTGSMAPWHTIVDDLPLHEAYPAEFGPDAIAVDRSTRAPQRLSLAGGHRPHHQIPIARNPVPMRVLPYLFFANPVGAGRGAVRSRRLPRQRSGC